MDWETVIGLEVHAELSTKTKIFCGCRVAFGGEPNTYVCPVCSGMPGVLPRLNYTVVEYAIRAGLALGCSITEKCKFDRKNYFYPDLPKSYQISQLYSPICRDGFLDIEVDHIRKTIGIREIHMEEDAGKLIHDPQNDNTHMDFNRCGVPLLEIVSHPDMRNSGEVLAYLQKLREILMYLDICDCKMQEGSLRADINLSVRPIGGLLGVRTEMKNLNSFKAIERAIEYETKRQIMILRSGGEVEQETRRWDDNACISYSMRSKENTQDYRYFPEPDLLPIVTDATLLTQIKNSLPELADQKRERYMHDYGLTEHDAAVITDHKNISALFESVTKISGEPIESAHLITGEIMRLMNQTNTLPENLSIDASKLAELIGFVLSGKISRNAYKEVVEAVFLHDVVPESYIVNNGLFMLTDNSAFVDAAKAVLDENQDALEEYRLGKEKVFGFLLGQTMRKIGSASNPDLARKALQDLLTADSMEHSHMD